jgi:hypothetical protein
MSGVIWSEQITYRYDYPIKGATINREVCKRVPVREGSNGSSLSNEILFLFLSRILFLVTVNTPHGTLWDDREYLACCLIHNNPFNTNPVDLLADAVASDATSF